MIDSVLNDNRDEEVRDVDMQDASIPTRSLVMSGLAIEQEASLLFRQEIQLSGTDTAKVLLYTTTGLIHGSWE